MNGHLLLILFGGPVAIGTPLLVARALVEGHADRTADAIKASAARQKAADRTKQVTR